MVLNWAASYSDVCKVSPTLMCSQTWEVGGHCMSFCRSLYETWLTFLLLHVLCRKRWRPVRPGSLRWSFSSSNSRSSSWRGWKMPRPGPSWENLSMCCWPLWLSFWSLSQLWPTVWSHWWRHARARSPPSSSSSCWPSCGETGTLSRVTHTERCSRQDDQTKASTCCFGWCQVM